MLDNANGNLPRQNDQKHLRALPALSPFFATLITSIGERCSIRSTKSYPCQRQGLRLSAWAELGTIQKAGSLILSANLRAGSHNLQLNTPTKSETNRQTRGFCGYTGATPHVLSKVFGKLQTKSRFPTGGIRRRTYSSSSMTGYTMKKRASGYLFSTTSTMPTSFLSLKPPARRRGKAT